jgi:aryl-alcohol dehydrogenase-like predicted oxidoreductase
MKHLPLGNDPTVHVSELCLGTMYFGTRIDEPTSFAILDRFVDAGGTFIDTANCYCFWTDGGQGGESERLIGRWLRSRGLRDKVVLASKVGAQIVDPSRPYSARNREGLAASTIKAQAAQSLKQLGVDRLDVYYTHVDDRATPLEQTLRGLAELVSNGDVAVVGASNYPTWRLALVRDIARRSGLPLFRAVQMRHSYLEARHLRVPAPEATQFPITPELLDYAGTDGNLTVLGYSALLSGAYARPDRPLPPDYDTPGADRRLGVLHAVAGELGATPNQVVLAWMLGGAVPVSPVLGVSSVAQLDEALGATVLALDEATMRRLNEA